uniref:hypothetical protein n=1 Tax=Pseudomonas fluorescens TaxID=294 RepID=UPI001F38BB90|nr:hypothetical protein [Pseudomonas fluorescens]
MTYNETLASYQRLLEANPGKALQIGDDCYAVLINGTLSGAYATLDGAVDLGCGFHAIRPPSPLSSGQAFHGHLATCSTAIRPGSRSAATQGLHC